MSKKKVNEGGMSLDARMKIYEAVSKNTLVRRVPVIIRVDGRSFHNFTKGFDRPFDNLFREAMMATACAMVRGIQGAKMAYTQSDEISILLTDHETIKTSAWFDNEVQKMVSSSAADATLEFNKAFRKLVKGRKDDGKSEIYLKKIDTAKFDSRVFNLPKDEVCNYFIWRQKDAVRNSIEAVGQAYFSHKKLHGMSCDGIQEMLFQEHGINFNNYPVVFKRGACTVKKYIEMRHEGTNEPYTRTFWDIDRNIPIFTKDRGYINQFLGNGYDESF